MVRQYGTKRQIRAGVVPRNFQPAGQGTYRFSHESASSSASSSPWNRFEARAVLMGVATFLLLQVGVQYRSLHIWEEMQKAQSGISSSLLTIESKLETELRSFSSGRVRKPNHGNNAPSSSPRQAEPAPQLPEWMEDYFEWHNSERAKLTQDNWRGFKLLIVRCLKADGNQCGMARHRLQSLPVSLMLAYQSQRLLFIRWEQPAPLEEFLLPRNSTAANRPGGSSCLDWRFPEWLHDELRDYDQYPMLRGSSRFGVNQVMNPDLPVVTMRHYTKEHGKPFFNENRQTLSTTALSKTNHDNTTLQPGYDVIFRSFWHRMFQPSPAVKSVLERDMETLELIRGEFVVAFLPTFITPNFQGPIETALDCVKQTAPRAYHNPEAQTVVRNDDDRLDLVVAAPSQSYIDFALTYTANDMVALKIPNDLLSLGHKDDDEDGSDLRKSKAKVSEYYQSFAFLFLLSYSKSVVFQYADLDGKWAAILSMNPFLSARFKRKKKSHCFPLEANELSPPPEPLKEDQVNEFIRGLVHGSE